jgi:hypothetical protein
LMVLLFCALVSSSEFILCNDSLESQTEQQDQSSDTSEKNTTFFNTAVDAVVPFVVVVLDQALHLIFEVVGLDRQPNSLYTGFINYPNQFLEVLFEHIVSTNAP